jgi:hypothetical protein
MRVSRSVPRDTLVARVMVLAHVGVEVRAERGRMAAVGLGAVALIGVWRSMEDAWHAA